MFLNYREAQARSTFQQYFSNVFTKDFKKGQREITKPPNNDHQNLNNKITFFIFVFAF